jgi:hypothetical protein
VARKTVRLVRQLTKAPWTPGPDRDADEQCDLSYNQAEGWPRPYRFVALCYEAPPAEPTASAEQNQLFATHAYTYRVFVTNHLFPGAPCVDWRYDHVAGAPRDFD